MTVYPLPTLAPTIDASGISAPAYNDILQSLLAIYTNIYGSDVILTPDTQDYQFLAALAQAMNDTNAACVSMYNAYSPVSAQGAGLSSVVKINGLRRLIPTASQAIITIVGVAGTTINGGMVGDNQNLGTKWTLPSVTIIPAGGSVNVLAVCTQLGAIAAPANTLTQILTPTSGWQTANNAAAAVVGQPVEADAQLRLRQSVSVDQPAQSPLSSVFAAVSNVSGVGRVFVYENDTSSTDVNGVPSHTIAVIVDSGTAQSIWNAIGSKKTPGTGTYGTQVGTYIDPAGQAQTVRFNYTAIQRIQVQVTIHGLAGFNAAAATAAIQASVVSYINSLIIGESVYYTRVVAAAVLQDSSFGGSFNVTALTDNIFGNPAGTADLAMAYNQAASCQASDVTVTVV